MLFLAIDPVYPHGWIDNSKDTLLQSTQLYWYSSCRCSYIYYYNYLPLGHSTELLVSHNIRILKSWEHVVHCSLLIMIFKMSKTQSSVANMPKATKLWIAIVFFLWAISLIATEDISWKMSIIGPHCMQYTPMSSKLPNNTIIHSAHSWMSSHDLACNKEWIKLYFYRNE